MPHLSGSICGGLDRGRTFTPGRSQFAFVAASPLRGRAALPGGKILCRLVIAKTGYAERQYPREYEEVKTS
jgi:hypothetical protein